MLRKRITALDYGIKELRKIPAVSFYYLSKYESLGSGRQVGSIAEEVQKVMPSFTFMNNTLGTPLLSIDWAQFHGVYIHAFQQIADKADAQAKEIDALKEENAKIKDLLTKQTKTITAMYNVVNDLYKTVHSKKSK